MSAQRLINIIPIFPSKDKRGIEGGDIEFTNFSDGYSNDVTSTSSTHNSSLLKRPSPSKPKVSGMVFKYHDIGDINLLTMVWFRTIQAYMSNDGLKHAIMSASIAVTIAFIFKVIRRSFGEIKSNGARVIYTLMAFYALMVESIVSRMSFLQFQFDNNTFAFNHADENNSLQVTHPLPSSLLMNPHHLNATMRNETDT